MLLRRLALRARGSVAAAPQQPHQQQPQVRLAHAAPRTHLPRAGAAAAAAAAEAGRAAAPRAQQQPRRQQLQQQHPEAAGSNELQLQPQQPRQEFPELQLVLPPPTHALVKQADYVSSSTSIEQCPPPRWPEFAVIGRSNVGKSSLINMLTGRKALALVSKEPGKTRCINHFIINKSWYLVDLPGYGYARTGRDQRREFDAFTRAFLLGRPTLAMVLLLVDCSVPPQQLDLSYAAWLGGQGLPFSLVFTKADKRKKGSPRAADNAAAFKAALLRDHGFAALPPSLVTSAAAGTGKGELLRFIASLRVLAEQGVARARADAEAARAE